MSNTTNLEEVVEAEPFGLARGALDLAPLAVPKLVRAVEEEAILVAVELSLLLLRAAAELDSGHFGEGELVPRPREARDELPRRLVEAIDLLQLALAALDPARVLLPLARREVLLAAAPERLRVLGHLGRALTRADLPCDLRVRRAATLGARLDEGLCDRAAPSLVVDARNRETDNSATGLRGEGGLVEGGGRRGARVVGGGGRAWRVEGVARGGMRGSWATLDASEPYAGGKRRGSEAAADGEGGRVKESGATSARLIQQGCAGVSRAVTPVTRAHPRATARPRDRATARPRAASKTHPP